MNKSRHRHGVRQARLSPNLPELLEKTAKILRQEGCGPLEIRAALLAMCGVQVEGVNLTSLRIFG